MNRRRWLRRRIPRSSAVDDLRWMPAISSLSDEQVDSLLAGHAPEGQDELAPLAEVATAVRWRAAHEPTPVMRYPLRHAVARAMLPGEPQSRGRLAHAALSGAAIAVLAVAGAADALPAPVQDAVADVGALVGIQVPGASDDGGTDIAEGSAPAAQPGFAEDEDDGADPGAARPSSLTPGGAVAADPGTPDDGEPASPATAPENADSGDEHSGVPSRAADAVEHEAASAGVGSDDGTPDAAQDPGGPTGEQEADDDDDAAVQDDDDAAGQGADQDDQPAGRRPPLGTGNGDE